MTCKHWFDGKVTLMCFDNVKKLHYNLSCCFSLSSTFFNTYSTFPKSLDMPQLSFTIPQCSSLSFIIFHHPLSYLIIILLLPNMFQHLPTMPCHPRTKTKCPRTKILQVKVKNYHGCPFWDLGMSQEHHPPPPKWWWSVFYTFIPLDANLFGVFI